MAKKQQKGEALERATAFIHETLLKNDPKFKTANFTVETRKILVKNKVPYEVDVLVTPTDESPYLGQVIFECKDWKRPVQRAQLSELDIKVEALGAAKGIMVARHITEGARALLEQKPRLSFVPCTDDFESPFHMEFVHTWHEFFPLNIALFERNVTPKDVPDTLDHEQMTCSMDGNPIDFAKYIDGKLNRIVKKDGEQNRNRYQSDSMHWRQECFEVGYSEGGFLINGRDIQKMQFRVTYWVEVRRQKIISKFELEKQGRVYFFEPIVDSKTGDKHEIEIVQLL